MSCCCDTDIYAADRIVSADPDQGTDTNLASAVANLTSGGTIFIKEGTYNISQTIQWSDINIQFVWSEGATVTTTGLGARPLFKQSSGLTTSRMAVFTNARIVGEDIDAAQYLLELTDVSGRANAVLDLPDIRSFRRVFSISGGDPTFVNGPNTITVNGGQIIPTTSDGTSILATTTGAYLAFLWPATFTWNACTLIDWTNGPPTLLAWHFSVDSDFVLQDCAIAVKGLCQADGLQVEHSLAYGSALDGSDVMMGANGSWSGRLRLVHTYLQSVEFILDDEAHVVDVGLQNAAKITCLGMNGSNMTLAEIIQNRETGGLGPAIPDAAIDIRAGCRVTINGADLFSATEALIKNASANGPVVCGSRFEASLAVKTIKDVGAGDYTLGVGNKGVSTGGGLSLAANSKVTIGDYNFA